MFTYYQIIGRDITTCRWLIPQKVVENVGRGKKHAHVMKKTIQKYVDKENTYGIGSYKAFEASIIIPATLVITQIENFLNNDDIVDANDVTHDGIVITNDDNVNANVVTYDVTIVTNNETIVINETHITPHN